MKKILQSSLFLSAVFLGSAQVLESDNYNSYTLGNVSTSMTTAGQGGMNLYNGAIANYQIVAGDAARVKYLAVTGGSDGTTTSSRYVYKTGLATAWAGRTSGNNIIKGSFEVYTGTSTNKHLSGVSIFGADNGIVGIGYNSQTKTINGRAYLAITADPSQDGYYNITGLTANTYPANTWVTLGFSYNKTTGAITYVVAGNALTLSVNGASTVPGFDPAEFDIHSAPTRTSTTDPANSGPTTFGIDNYVIEASNSAVLGTSDIKKEKTSIIAIGPNPTSEYLNILTELKINKAEIFDMSGKKVNSTLEGNQINVKHLNPGSYIINLETSKGKTVEKFIKK
ncbi:Por secretion system C-terminal sorting domain-containing protein [Chryseobacterium arachidis]|uniref:Por secretion system C-terminal sorting domain-containing protein n=1 Tax=Chryseobacterium arachidis TaxID=1416778 RepID=A0A1M5BB70_9FLAO|nr:T9SS type A sorting domain-containing protein [Chryseobacterium arachidis]SHF39754.1 Por secretion system C-terminal sorting domain-containing protein [Chryseobacterium arachidis]